MPAATFDLIGDSIVEQGSYWSLTIRHPGNLSGASLKGQIKADYGEDKPLQSFRFTPFTYDDSIDKSVCIMFLAAGQTQLLPLPPDEGFWRYDVKLFRPTQDPIRLLQGRVFVSPGITDIGGS